MDVAASRTLEAAESELNRFIERQAQQGTAARERDELWRISEKKYRERKTMQHRAAWFAHFCRMADSHRALSEHYERRAEELCEEGEE